MLVLQIICIALLSIFMGIMVIAWIAMSDKRKEIDDKLTDYIVEANNDYCLRFDMAADHHILMLKSDQLVEEKLHHLVSYKVKTFRDFDTGLLNAKALEIFMDRYNDQDILHFSMMKVEGITESDKRIEEVLHQKAYTANKVGIELFKATAAIDDVDVYRLEEEIFLIISRSSMVLEIMTSIKGKLKQYSEVEKIYMGSSHRVTKKKDIDKCIMFANKKMQDHIEKES